MEPPRRVAASPHTPADEDLSQSVGQTSRNHLGAQGGRPTRPNQRQPSVETDDWEPEQPWSHSFQPAFQDSNLSPALSLLPGVEHNFTEYSLFQQSDNEFAPLRAYPDISMASERFHFPPQDHTTQASEGGSLSQHPLAQETIISEEGVSSCCSLSQHSLSLVEEGRQEEAVPSPTTDTPDGGGATSRDDSVSRELQTDPPDKPAGEAAEDETFFLSKDIPAQHLLELLQKDIGMPSSSSSAVSSVSETSVKTASFTESKITKNCKPCIDQSMARREGPPGEASAPQQQKRQPDRDLYPDQSQTSSTEVCNITMGSRSTKPDDSSELLHRELLSEVERRSSHEAESKNQPRKSPTPTAQSLPIYPTGMSEGKPSVTRTNLGGLPWTGPFSAEKDLWLSGNQTGIDGSYLGFLPQSQSTPGVFKVPPKSDVKAKFGQLSAIESSKEKSYQSNTEISPPSAGPVVDVHRPDRASQSQEEATSAKVQSLPSLNYMQKVDAWRANQSSGKMSLFDSLALQGFSGVSPKKKAYSAVSDSLSQQLRSVQQAALSGAADQNVTQSSSTASASSRGEAVGSSPSDKDNTGSAARPSTSSFGKSQSHSSVSTIVTLVQKDQQTKRTAERDDVQRQPSTTVQPAPRVSLSQFSDVSPNPDLTLSSSQESYTGGNKLGTSLGASSVVSLEVDNYTPYWTSKLSTPPPPPSLRELNIEDRIPLYLHNLGIDQSPSTILTPFAPRGPIREPEFSPTDLCTIKGSIGTPTKSTQLSEGGSPQKGEFSRCSVLSVDSSMSIPLSLDSLGPGVSFTERPRRPSPSSDIEAIQSESRLASSTLQTTQQQHMDSSLTSSQNTSQPEDRSGTDPSLGARRFGARDLESSSQMSRLEQSAEHSVVSSNALLEIRKLLSQAENFVSAGSSSASPAAPRLLSDDDIRLSLRKKSSRLQDSSFSSSQLGVRSSSDSMLTSERLRESSIGQESVTSLGQLNYPSTQALVNAQTSGAYRRPPDSTVSRAAGPLVLDQSACRAEPEGCSAAPPDSTAPPQPPVIPPSPAVSSQRLTSTPTDTEEEPQAALEAPVQSSSASPVQDDCDQAVMSDGSSESSLAVRVAKLLQSDSTATVVSSTPSSTDHEESKARECVKLKTAGQQREPLELDTEDRKRIEEIKRELLLKNPIKSVGSTDTESSAASSVRPPQRMETSTPQPSQPLQGLHTDLHKLQTPRVPDIEAQIREIAAREGVTLPRTVPKAFTSITIATRKRSTSTSTSPSPSTSPAPPLSPAPEPLHLAELSTEAAKEPANQNLTAAQWSQKSQNVVGGQFEEPRPPSQSSVGQDATTKDTQPIRQDELPVQDSFVSGLTSEPQTRTGHISRVRLTLSPKTIDVHSSHTDAVTGLQQKEFVPLRHSPSAASSPDEGVGLSSPPEWNETREPIRKRGHQRPETSTLFRTAVTSTSTQSFTPAHRVVVSPKLLNADTPTVPVLLPYKPRGSEELFYVPQTEVNVSSTDHSDTTMESSHTGSDDAVPPHFSSEVLGSRDAGSDRGVAIRHSEGIYSKRLKTAAFKMHEPAHRVSADGSSQTPQLPPQAPSAFTRVPVSSSSGVSRRDQGTSPVQFSHDQPEPRHVRFQPVVNSQSSHHSDQSSAPQAGEEPDQERRCSDLLHSAAQQSSSTLDELWQRFCREWRPEESRPTSDREASLLERLERLSRLLHSTRGSNVAELQGETSGKERRKVTREVKSVGCEARAADWRVSGGRKVEGEPLVHRQAWTQRPQEASQQPADEDSITSSFSHDSTQSPYLCPADRDESETLSTMSGSMSTVDTARLIRAFGAHRVQHVKTSSSLSKLYSTINRQREGREQRRGRNRDSPHSITPSDTTATDESTVTADSASSGSTYTVPTHHGPSKTLAAKRGVKTVSRGIQTDDLELVRNGTRSHTRDVETTFPSPETRPSLSSLEKRRGGRRSQGSQKQKRSKRSPPQTYPSGVSWFISADRLRSEANKENRPEEEELRPSTAWFEPYSKIHPWREQFRKRQVHDDRNTHHSKPKTTSSALTRVSLQEALAMRRPDFISQSRQRVQRLALQAEERKLRSTRERDGLFSWPGGPGRLTRPTGTALLRRAVPRKEMIQRSKHIYENLPEVKRRKEEERRKAEYRSYRLNAQLYNKRITNHVLGRRPAWQ